MDCTTGTATGILHHAMRTEASTTTVPAPIDHAQREREPWSMTATDELLDSDEASSENAKSDADWNRCSGFFSRQRCTTRSSPGGAPGTICKMPGGSSFRMAVIVSADVGFWN